MAEKPRAGGKWTESRFWSFIRSGLRGMSRRWPPIYDALEKARRPYKGKNKRRKWEYQCCECSKWFAKTSVQVHHEEECGSLRSEGDLAGFVTRLFCESDKLKVICKKCHEALH